MQETTQRIIKLLGLLHFLIVYRYLLVVSMVTCAPKLILEPPLLPSGGSGAPTLCHLYNLSPVQELSFLPASYKLPIGAEPGRAKRESSRVQDNLHAHAQNAAISPLPKKENRGKNHIWKYFLGLWCNFLKNNI